MVAALEPDLTRASPPGDRASEARAAKRKPQARLRAAGEADADAGLVADWASLHGDLARRPAVAGEAPVAPVEWRIHDRTHVEFALDYPLGATREQTWEAYFFVPESFRLHEETYDKRAIYDDLLSYVRYAVPVVPFHEIASTAEGAVLARLRTALATASGCDARSDDAARAMRKLRLFACLTRASGVTAMREVERTDGRDAAAAFHASCGAVAFAFRRVLAEAEGMPIADEVLVAARWADEDISLVLETLCATLALSLEAHAPDHGDVAGQLAARAVKEARHRRDRGYDSVGSSTADPRWTEHFEFRRHVLKRFTASVLWLSLEVRQAAPWAVHALYAVAAAAAMTFALTVTAHATSAASVSFARYAVLIVLGYALKDRIKALLQVSFTKWLGRKLPDRKWSITDRERGRCLGKIDERAAFLPFRLVPPEVLAKRRVTRAHALEEQARPERVLLHKKTVVMQAERLEQGATDGEFSMLTEICRLNLHRWLRDTDDPNRKIVFADPSDARIYQVKTRRVYNINVVYRLRGANEDAADWHRIRVVVSRKGIERIDTIC